MPRPGCVRGTGTRPSPKGCRGGRAALVALFPHFLSDRQEFPLQDVWKLRVSGLYLLSYLRPQAQGREQGLPAAGDTGDDGTPRRTQAEGSAPPRRDAVPDTPREGAGAALGPLQRRPHWQGSSGAAQDGPRLHAHHTDLEAEARAPRGSRSSHRTPRAGLRAPGGDVTQAASKRKRKRHSGCDATPRRRRRHVGSKVTQLRRTVLPV